MQKKSVSAEADQAWTPVFTGVTLVFLFFFLTSCAQESNERKLVLYTDTPEVLAKELARAFEGKTGIRVEPVLEGTSWLMSRMRSEKYRPIADVFMGASGTLPGIVLAKEGIFERFMPAGFESMPVQEGKLLLRDSDWRWVGFGFAALGLAYSKKETPPASLPKRWEELAGDSWHKALTVWDPSVSGTATLFLVSSLQRAKAQGQSEEEGWKFLSGFYRNLKKYSEDGPPAFAVAQGIVKLGVHLDNQFIYYKEKAKVGKEDLGFHLPAQSAILTDPAALLANAPHPEEGRKFIEFLLSPEAQDILSRYFWTKDAQGRPRLPSDHPYQQGEGSAQKLLNAALEMDFDWMAASFDRARIYWQNHVEQ